MLEGTKDRPSIVLKKLDTNLCNETPLNDELTQEMEMTLKELEDKKKYFEKVEEEN